MTMFGAIAMRGLGVLLLVAAALKLYSLAVEPVGGVGFFSEPWVQTLIVEWEILLGTWLVWGVNRALAWLAANVTFVCFAAVSLWQGWIGQVSCGCFGAISVSPWVALSSDVVGLVFLAFAWRHAWTRQAPALLVSAIRPVAIGVCGVSAMLACMAAIATIALGSPHAGLAYLRGDSVTVTPRLIDVGEGYQGDRKEAVIRLHNWSAQPIRVIGGTSDCSCVVTRDLPVTLSPDESCNLTVRLVITGSAGQFTRTAQLFTDDDRHRSVRFRLTGRCRVGTGETAE
jgi:hypothetical protein